MSGWVPAPEIGAGVYKTTGIGYEPYSLVVEINGVTYDLPKLCHPGLPNGGNYCNGWIDELTKPVDATYNPGQYTNYPIVNYWDGIEAVYAAIYNGNTTYIRFKNGDNPAAMTIKSARSGATVEIYGRSHIAIKNFEIRAADRGVKINRIQPTNTYSNYITVDNNKIINGRVKIEVAFSRYLTISNNVLTMQGYSDYVSDHSAGSHDIFGAHVAGTTYEDGVQFHAYQYYKYPVGYASSGIDDLGMYILTGTTGFKIYNNEIYRTIDGIMAFGSGHEINNNILHDMPSAALVMDGRYTGGDISIHDNLIYNVNDMLRYGDFQAGVSGVRIYRNRFWLPPRVGQNIHYHCGLQEESNVNASEIWYYHNTFSGGYNFEYMSEACMQKWGIGLSHVSYLNNIMSSYQFEEGDNNRGYGEQYIRECAHNWITGVNKTNWCTAAENIDNGTTLLWNTTTPHDFQLPAGSNAIDAGIDISQPFTIDGTQYTALPGFSPGYYQGSAPDMGAVEYGSGGATYQCSDGADNDGDGLIDYPADPGCSSAVDNDEYNAPLPVCGDGTCNGTETCSSCEQDCGECPPVSGDLVSYWSMDTADISGNTLIDKSGANDCTIYGSVPASGVINEALSFDGVDDMLGCGNDPSLNVTEALTISVWIKQAIAHEAVGSNFGVMAKADPMVGWNWQLRFGDNSGYDRLGFQFNTNLGPQWINLDQDLVVGQWYHVVGTFDGSTARMYLNGELKDTNTFNALVGSDADLVIGHEGWNLHFNGLIDEARIYSQALTESEIQDLYNNIPTYQCNDGIDNDGDTLIDYPADPGCTSSTDNDETDPTTTYGITDFIQLVADWLQSIVSPADINSDGIVNARDLGIIMSNWE